jgi:hypothetical protein
MVARERTPSDKVFSHVLFCLPQVLWSAQKLNISSNALQSNYATEIPENKVLKSSIFLRM